MARDYEKQDQAIKLRSAYRALFKSVVVSPAKPNGHREFKFILSDRGSIIHTEPRDPGQAVLVEDAFCTSPKMVAPGRIELPRPCGHWILSPARLPIPPQGHSRQKN